MKLLSHQAKVPTALRGSSYRLINLLLFKLTWLLLVLGQEATVIYAILLQGVSVLLHPAVRQLVIPTLVLTAGGILIDYLLSVAGVYQFPGQGFPVWLALLWFAFILALPQGFAFVGKLHPLWQIACGMFAGTVSYWAGYSWGAISFLLPLPQTLGIIALIWGSFLPLAIYLLKQYTRPPLNILLMTCMLLVMLVAGSVSIYAAPVNLLGRGQAKFLVKPVYEAYLYADSENFTFPSQQAFTFALKYRVKISKQQIIRETLHQWQLQNISVPDQWQELLENIIVDVSASDTLAMQVDKTLTATLQHNKREIAVITDSSFVQAFAGIWLAENTSKPELRHNLLGLL